MVIKGVFLIFVVSMEVVFVVKNVIGGDEKMIYLVILSVVFMSFKLVSIGISVEEVKVYLEKY